MEAIRPFWEYLSGSERTELRQIGQIVYYAKSYTLVRQRERSDHVIIVRSGFVRVATVADSGYQAVLAIRGPGDLLGELACVDGEPRSATLQALTDLKTLIIPAQRFLAFRSARPAVDRVVQRLVTRRLREADRSRAAAAAEPVERRLAAAVLRLGDQYGTRRPDGSIQLGLPLSQDDLAGLALTSRRTVGRVLAEWRAAGWIRTARWELLLTDPIGLASCLE